VFSALKEVDIKICKQRMHDNFGHRYLIFF
jgi:hypothetical protein